MGNGSHRRCGQLAAYIGWWKRYKIRYILGHGKRVNKISTV